MKETHDRVLVLALILVLVLALASASASASALALVISNLFQCQSIYHYFTNWRH